MLTYDTISRRATFEVRADTRRPVSLLVGEAASRLARVPMEPRDDRWIAQLPLAPGLYLYAFEVDGRQRCDGAQATVRLANGRRCTLAALPVRSNTTRKNDALV